MCNSFDDVINFSKKNKKLIVITRGEKGAIAIKKMKLKNVKQNKS